MDSRQCLTIRTGPKCEEGSGRFSSRDRQVNSGKQLNIMKGDDQHGN